MMSYLLQSFFFKLLGSLLSLQPFPLQSLPLLLFLRNTNDAIHLQSYAPNDMELNYLLIRHMALHKSCEVDSIFMTIIIL